MIPSLALKLRIFVRFREFHARPDLVFLFIRLELEMALILRMRICGAVVNLCCLNRLRDRSKDGMWHVYPC